MKLGGGVTGRTGQWALKAVGELQGLRGSMSIK